MRPQPLAQRHDARFRGSKKLVATRCEKVQWPASDLLYGIALHAKKRDLFSLKDAVLPEPGIDAVAVARALAALLSEAPGAADRLQGSFVT
jgi:hypothetical protein